MLKTTILCVMALLCLNFYAFSQTTDITAGGFQIGQTVPNLAFSVKEYSSDKIKLNQPSGKITILDFWATWCSPCIAMLPVMDSIQKSHPEKVQFISVTSQKSTEVFPFLEKLKQNQGRGYDIPQITDDRQLSSLFPHTILPHYVWIKDGKVAAITGHAEVNQANILAMFSSTKSLVAKQDLSIKYDPGQPLLINGNGGDGKSLLFHSMFSGRIDGHSARYANMEATPKGKRIVFTNLGLNTILINAFAPPGEHFNINRVEYKIKDSIPFFFKQSGLTAKAWQQKHTYCYELLLPFEQRGRAWEFFRQDLMRYFPQYSVRIEDREKLCYVLVKNKVFKGLASSGGKSSIDVNANGLIMKNLKVSFLLRQLNVSFLQRSEYPVVDGTEISYPFDLEFSAKMSDISSINSGLEPYGLEFRLIKKSIGVLVIREEGTIQAK